MQHIVVSLLVVGAALVSLWKLMPAGRRQALLSSLHEFLRRRQWLPLWRERVLAPRLQAGAGAGCAGCAVNTQAQRQRASR